MYNALVVLMNSINTGDFTLKNTIFLIFEAYARKKRSMCYLVICNIDFCSRIHLIILFQNSSGFYGDYNVSLYVAIEHSNISFDAPNCKICCAFHRRSKLCTTCKLSY